MNNVTIIDKNGNGILAEGVSYITIANETASKNYIFYTLNETVENGLTKIYIAEVTDGGPSEVKIADEEWANIKKIMVSILHAEEVPNVSFNKLDGNTFNVSEPKKLAIDLVKKQTLVDTQNMKTLESAQNVAVTEPATTGSFFNTAVTDNAAIAPTETDSVPNIFENPLQPEVTPPSLGGIEDPTKVPINNNAGLENPVDKIDVIEEVPNMDQTMVTMNNEVSAMPAEAPVQAPIQNSKPSMEEVKNALDVLNRYFQDGTNILVSEPVQPALVPQAVVPEPIQSPVMMEVPVQNGIPQAPVMPDIQPEVAISSIDMVTPLPGVSIPTMPEATTPVQSEVTVPVQPEISVPVQPMPVEQNPVMMEAPVQNVVPQAPVMPAVPQQPEVMPVQNIIEQAQVMAPSEPMTPGNSSIPVQMPTNAVDPSMINTAGFEGLTVESN